MIYVLYAVLGLWAILNIVVVIKYSLREMAVEFWVNQNVFGKICANIFYCLAWVVSAVLVAVVCLLGWLSFGIYYIGKFAVGVLKPLYVKAIKLNL